MFDVVAIRPARAAEPVRERERAADATSALDADASAPRDRVTISSEARTRAADGKRGADRDEKDGKVTADGRRKDGTLTPEAQRRVAWLQQRDAHVRQHEAAHQAAGGSLTGAASFTYEVGPDGRSYAIGGEVPVRLASGRTPDETISNARQARRAALAPSDPSPADLAVAAAATELEQQGQMRKARLASQAYAKQTRGRDGKDEVEPAATTSYDGSLASPDAEPAGATLVAA